MRNFEGPGTRCRGLKTFSCSVEDGRCSEVIAVGQNTVERRSIVAETEIERLEELPKYKWSYGS